MAFARPATREEKDAEENRRKESIRVNAEHEARQRGS